MASVRLSLALCRRLPSTSVAILRPSPVLRSGLAARLASSSSSPSTPTSAKLIPLSSLSPDELGPSILWQKSTLPEGSGKTAHDVVASGVRAAKVLSLASSVAGVVMVPVLSSYLWEAAAERPSMMVFALISNSFLVLLSFTPLLLHFLAKRFPLDIHYNEKTGVFSTIHYNFLMQKRVRRFRAEEVVDAAVAPEMKKVWIPLATLFVHGSPLLVSLDRNAYRDASAFDRLTTNVHIPPNHD